MAVCRREHEFVMKGVVGVVGPSTGPGGWNRLEQGESVEPKGVRERVRVPEDTTDGRGMLVGRSPAELEGHLSAVRHSVAGVRERGRDRGRLELDDAPPVIGLVRIAFRSSRGFRRGGRRYRRYRGWGGCRFGRRVPDGGTARAGGSAQQAEEGSSSHNLSIAAGR